MCLIQLSLSSSYTEQLDAHPAMRLSKVALPLIMAMMPTLRCVTTQRWTAMRRRVLALDLASARTAQTPKTCWLKIKIVWMVLAGMLTGMAMQPRHAPRVRSAPL